MRNLSFANTLDVNVDSQIRLIERSMLTVIILELSIAPWKDVRKQDSLSFSRNPHYCRIIILDDSLYMTHYRWLIMNGIESCSSRDPIARPISGTRSSNRSCPFHPSLLVPGRAIQPNPYPWNKHHRYHLIWIVCLVRCKILSDENEEKSLVQKIKKDIIVTLLDATKVTVDTETSEGTKKKNIELIY